MSYVIYKSVSVEPRGLFKSARAMPFPPAPALFLIKMENAIIDQRNIIFINFNNNK